MTKLSQQLKQPLKLSNSKANTWTQCHKKYDYKYNKKLSPKQRSLPLERGDWLHQMLQAHYLDEPWKKVHRKLTKQFNNLMIEERDELGDLPGQTKGIMLNYLHHYRKEDKRFVVVDAELDELVQLPNGLEFQFIIDLIVEDKLNGRVWLWDHKTLKSFMEDEYMMMETQLTRYHWCAEKYLGIKNLAGVMFNEIRTKTPSVPELTQTGRLSKRKIDTDYRTALKAILDYGLDPDDYKDFLSGLKNQQDKWFRRTPLPKDRPATKQQIKELYDVKHEINFAAYTGNYPRSIDKSCKWSCEYQKICNLELHGVDPSPVIKANFDVDKKRRENKKEKASGGKR